MKKKILFVVSNLRRTGPVNQLSYIIGNLDFDKFECKVLTLSSEPIDSKLSYFIDAGIDVESLSLSRFQGVFKGRNLLKKYIDNYLPDIIQTQGIRADSLLCNMSLSVPWITTSRNFPAEDYPAKFGKIKGRLMAYKHIKVLSQCRSLVSCSNSISKKLENIGISSSVICNGVPFEEKIVLKKSCGDVFKILTVGSLIKRKNVKYIVNLANELNKNGFSFELTVLGDGPLLSELKRCSPPNVFFLGNVDNVSDFFRESDLFISASFSEGLPNTVLESISYGVPVVLSDIPPHIEITSKLSSNFSYVFSLDLSEEEFAISLVDYISTIKNIDKLQLINDASSHFSAKYMSKKYQTLYEAH